MAKNKRNFNKDAASWDYNPSRLKLRDSIFKTISSRVDLNSNMNILDFGCGTGLLTLKLEPFAGSIVGVDSSEGMLEVLNDKIRREGISNIKTYSKIEDRNILSCNYDLIVTSMTLHHIESIESIIKIFYKLLKKSGQLYIIDLDREDGSFHKDNNGVFHCGFNRDSLRLELKRAGFCNVGDTTITKIVKPDVVGKSISFSVFLMMSKKC